MQLMTGRLGKDPENKETNSGKTVAKTTMAITRGWGDKEQTIWIDLIAWEDMAPKLGAYSKGDIVTVRGEIKERPWKTKDGEERKAVEMTVRGIFEPTHTDAPAAKPAKQAKKQPDPISDDDLPW